MPEVIIREIIEADLNNGFLESLDNLRKASNLEINLAKDILKKIGISLNECKRNWDKFTNKKIIKTDQAGKLIYNDDGNLIRKFDAK